MGRSTATTSNAAMRSLSAQPYEKCSGVAAAGSHLLRRSSDRARVPSEAGWVKEVPRAERRTALTYSVSLYACVVAPCIGLSGIRNAGHARICGGL